jgi:hypothetical protein
MVKQEFRDIATHETLKAVNGAQDEPQLHWGGHMSLPEGHEITPPPPELESLAGEKEPSVDPLLEIRASEVGLPEEGGKWLCRDLRVPCLNRSVTCCGGRTRTYSSCTGAHALALCCRSRGVAAY